MNARTGKITASEAAIRAAERRAISRQLHGSTSQLLVVLRLQLENLSRSCGPAAAPVVKQMSEVISDIHKSIREIDLLPTETDEEIDAARLAVARVFHSMGRLDQSHL